MDQLATHIITGVVALVVGLLLRNLEPKSKVVWWSPHTFLFNVPNPTGSQNPNIVVKTDSVTVQNIGRKAAENVELVFAAKPDHFQIQPAVNYSTTNAPQGEFVVTVPTLGRREFFTLQILSYATLPDLRNIRWKDGTATPLQVQFQRVYPRLAQYIAFGLMIVGLAFILYWLIRWGVSLLPG